MTAEAARVRTGDPFRSMADHLQVEAHEAENMAARIAKDDGVDLSDAARYVSRLAGVLRTAAVALHERERAGQPVKRRARTASPRAAVDPS